MYAHVRLAPFGLAQVNDALEEQTRRQRQNLDFERIPDADLFFVDTVRRG